MDRIVTCVLGFGVLAFAFLIWFAESNQPEPTRYETKQGDAMYEGRGEYYYDKYNRLRFRYFENERVE